MVPCHPLVLVDHICNLKLAIDEGEGEVPTIDVNVVNPLATCRRSRLASLDVTDGFVRPDLVGSVDPF